MSFSEKPVSMGSRGYGKLQWPAYTSRMQRDVYNRTLSRGFTQEEVQHFIDQKRWVNGAYDGSQGGTPDAG